MGAPDCETCAMLGYRSCDICGGSAWAGRRSADEYTNLYRLNGRELCGFCCADASAAVWE